MTEQEEFEFRARLEKEQAAAAPKTREVPPMTTAENIALAADKILTELGKTAPDILPSRESLIAAISSAAGTMRGGANLISEGLGERLFPKQGESIVGALLDPAALAIGGGAMKVAQAIPQIPKIAPAMGIARNVLGGAVGGGAIGGLSEDSDAATGALVGGAIPAALPAVGFVGKKLSNAANAVLSSITKSGRASVGHKMVLDQLPAEERAAVLARLQQAGVDTSPLGSPLTSAQVIANTRAGASDVTGARLAALQDEISRMRGGEQLASRMEGQRDVQQGILDTLTGAKGWQPNEQRLTTAADEALLAAKQGRENVANFLYPKGTVTGDAELDAILSRPAVRTALGIEEKMAANAARPTQIGERKAADFLMNTPVQFEKYPIKVLQEQYQQLDKAAKNLYRTSVTQGATFDAATARDILRAKASLGEWLSAKSPEWAKANKVFAGMSRPISQMKIGQSLEESWKQSPESFLKSTGLLTAQEKLIRGATGRPGESLARVMEPNQVGMIGALRGEAQLGQQLDALKKIAKPDLSDEKFFQIPNVLNMWATITNRILRGRGEATVDQVTKAAAEALADPKKLQALLREDIAARAAKLPVPADRTGAAIGGVTSGMLFGEEQ